MSSAPNYVLSCSSYPTNYKHDAAMIKTLKRYSYAILPIQTYCSSASLFWEGIDICSASHVKASVKYVFITLNSSFVSVRVMRSTWIMSPNRIQPQTEMGEKKDRKMQCVVSSRSKVYSNQTSTRMSTFEMTVGSLSRRLGVTSVCVFKKLCTHPACVSSTWAPSCTSEAQQCQGHGCCLLWFGFQDQFGFLKTSGYLNLKPIWLLPTRTN